MTLPNADQAFVDMDKLTEYCLNPAHPRGRHKARVFASALGITADHADYLRSSLLEAARNEEAIIGESDSFGQRFVVEFELTGPAGIGLVRSAWIIRQDEDFPRLTTCHVV